jgi:hypothetical protein
VIDWPSTIFVIVWFLGMSVAGGLYAYEVKMGREKADGDVLWVLMFLWFLAIGIWIGEAAARRVKARSTETKPGGTA